MGTKIARVHSDLISVFGNVGKTFAEDIKRRYNLDSLYVSDITASQILAGKYRGKRIFNFRIKKTNSRSGVLELIG